MSTYEKKLALYKNNKIRITQYGGMVRLKDGGEDYFDPDHQSDNDYVAMSHQGYRATDITIYEKDGSITNKLYAPFSVKCIFNDELPSNDYGLTSQGCILSIFESVDKIFCAKDNQEHVLTIIMMHGGSKTNEDLLDGTEIDMIPKAGEIYKYGKHIYQMGVQGTVAGTTEKDRHIHMDILPNKITNDDGEINWESFSI